MKIFIYKTFIVTISAYILFQFTVGIIIRNYENKVENLIHNQQTREKIIDKLKEEIKSENEKENIFTTEEKNLLSKFINKVKKELSNN